jgi:ribosomal protein L28
MKLLISIFLFFPCFTFAQTGNKILVDSLKFVTDMPYICRDTVPTKLSNGCGDKIFWRTVQQKQSIVNLLMDKLSAYTALQEIIKGIPTFELLGVKFDKNGCGYCSYWTHLQKNIKNRRKFQVNVQSWYENNKENLVWVTSSQILTCDCAGRHPNGGHFELKN